jgi:hypothetical protein
MPISNVVVVRKTLQLPLWRLFSRFSPWFGVEPRALWRWISFSKLGGGQAPWNALMWASNNRHNPESTDLLITFRRCLSTLAQQIGCGRAPAALGTSSNWIGRQRRECSVADWANSPSSQNRILPHR